MLLWWRAATKVSGDAAVPALQKDDPLSTANNKLVVTATQMMESMITNPTQRVPKCLMANAVLTAPMLSCCLRNLRQGISG